MKHEVDIPVDSSILHDVVLCICVSNHRRFPCFIHHLMNWLLATISAMGHYLLDIDFFFGGWGGENPILIKF